jgi:hypothetical protein
VIPCSWKQSFGIDCPSCGAQRSFIALLHGDLFESLKLFPALIPLIVLAIVVAVHIFRPISWAPRFIVIAFSLSALLMLGNWTAGLLPG